MFWTNKIVEMEQTVSTERWVDSIVYAMQLLGGNARYADLYPVVRLVREKGGLSIPDSFDDIVRGRIQEHSSDSLSFNGRKDIFMKLDTGHWGLRESYKNAQTFSHKPVEDKNEEELQQNQLIELPEQLDNMAIGQDGRQLLDIEEAKVKKTHYKYEGRLNASSIKYIKRQKGYVCEACGMSFASRYPNLGNDFIECHHKVPYAEMREGEKRALNVDDFIVLCSNCHKMIHRRKNKPLTPNQLIVKMAMKTNH